MRVIDLATIQAIIKPATALAAVTEAFIAYSNGLVTTPPVGHLNLPEANGELHIKYGHLRGSPTFTVKLATGFYRNPERGLPSGNGCMLVFDASTGALLMLLEDEGWLTELRTGLAGAIAARACGMTNPHRIGIIGTGVQARFQLRCLSLVSPCRSAMVFGRSPERTARYIADMEQDGFEVVAASSIAELARQCDLLVTTTNSHTPLLHANDLRLGMHVTAMGADGGGKNELDPHIYDHAGLCVVDSLSQASAFGDTSFALQRGCVSRSQLTELGMLCAAPIQHRQKGLISVADLTGVACQDLAIANCVVEALTR
jgi:ornithine cyclodeaminase